MKAISERLDAIASEAAQLCRNVVLDYRVRDGLVNVATILAAVAHMQARIEAGVISTQISRPDKPLEHLHD